MSDDLENLLHEERSFPPSPEFAAQANASAGLFEEAVDREAFWTAQARDLLTWDTAFTQVLDFSDAPFARWFADGTLNAAYNALDRHVDNGLGERVAIHFEAEDGTGETWTYARLRDEVARTANALTGLGVGLGDRVAVYMPMIPQAVVAMLACARIGAPHSVVFGGFSAEALHSRILDASARMVITTDGQFRRGTTMPLKGAVDEAIAHGDTPIEHVLVYRRTGGEVAWDESRDVWWHDVVPRQSTEHTPVPVPAEHPLFILYTSGTTGKPKGILHTTGGYLTQTAYTHRNVFDLKPETDVYWCTADVGWITGHSYVAYAPLVNGATQVIYEGTPDTPHRGRWWEIVQKYGVTILYTAPTAIRACMKWGEELPNGFDLSSLRLLGSVGEPINPEAWMWYRRVIGHDRCPIVDTWWQTETGAIMISPLPGVTATKPGSAQRALPGIGMDVVNDLGEPVPNGGGGYLVLTEPWPAMLRGIWGDQERYRETYWSRFPGMYFAGDGAKRDEQGYLWLLGRVDDVMNIAGHRMSTTEVESALVDHRSVAEAAVVGKNDAISGQAIFAFVILKSGQEPSDALAVQLREHVAYVIGPIARPKFLMFVPDLPKTRSGKIMRRLLRDIAEGRTLGDVTTLADANVVDTIRSNTGKAEEE